MLWWSVGAAEAGSETVYPSENDRCLRWLSRLSFRLPRSKMKSPTAKLLQASATAKHENAARGCSPLF